MKLTMLKNSLTSNLSLKVVSCILGCWFWFLLSGSHPVSITTEIPVYFYGSLENKQLEAPQHISIDLQCTRSQAYTLDTQKLAAHVNADRLTAGVNNLLITREHIFLPPGVTLLHCKPAFIPITVS